MARQGLSVLKAPVPLAGAILFQCLGWLLQLLAVYATMQAFGIDAPLPAAGLVLVLMNVATIVPLWPGNVGLVQAAVALPLRNYGVPYSTGFAFGLALQAIEIACGVGLAWSRSPARGSRSRCCGEQEQDDEQSRPGTSSTRCASWSTSSSRMRALLCPRASRASCPRARPRRRSREGFGGGARRDRAAGRRRGEGTAEVAAAPRSAASGARASVSDPLGRPVDRALAPAPGRARGRRGGGRDRAPAAPPDERDPLRASSRGLGELARGGARAGAASLLVALGGTATVDGGAGLREVVGRCRPARRALRRADAPRGRRARCSGRRRARRRRTSRARARLAALDGYGPTPELPGSGAAGGLGAALAALGAELVPGAAAVLDLRVRRARSPAATSSSPARAGGRDDARGEGAGRGRGRAPRPACAASSSAAACGRVAGRGDRRAVGRPGRAPTGPRRARAAAWRC